MNLKKTFDELAIAREFEKEEVKSCTKTNMCIYAKYLRYKKIVDAGMQYDDVTEEILAQQDNQIEKELISFCENTMNLFHYDVHFNIIDDAVALSRKYKLKLPQPTPITRKEWSAIMSIDNDNYRRMLFVMLVEAKYKRLYNVAFGSSAEITENTKFYVYMTKSEIMKVGGVKFKTDDEKIGALYELRKAGFFGITENKLRLWYINIVDMSGDDVIEYVSDYEHIDLYYEMLCGNSKIGKCEKCGKLFRQGNAKQAKYCREHRGTARIETQTLICVDCGNPFIVGSKSRRKCRCDKCQKEYRKAYDRERKAKLKNVV